MNLSYRKCAFIEAIKFLEHYIVMNPIFQDMAIQNASRKNKSYYKDDDNNRDVKRVINTFAFKVKREVLSYFLLALGILLAGFGLKSFLLSGGFIDGGITGISLLISEVTGASLPLLIFLINIPFVILGFTQIGKHFALKTAVGISGFAISLALIDYPIITNDKLLIAVFGGFFLGGGIGLAIRGGGVLDGTEVMAIYLDKKTALSLGDIILLFNIVIFSVAAYLLSIEVALYSILTYVAASKTIDYILEGIDEYTGVTIISSLPGEIRIMITEELKRGVTVYKGSRGFGKSGQKRGEIDILFSVVTRLEVTKLKTEIEKIDPDAFIIMSSIKETKGGMIKKRALHNH